MAFLLTLAHSDSDVTRRCGRHLRANLGKTMAQLIATGRVDPLVAPFSVTRFRQDRMIQEAASAGTHR
jgi:hypothetical protein